MNSALGLCTLSGKLHVRHKSIQFVNSEKMYKTTKSVPANNTNNTLASVHERITTQTTHVHHNVPDAYRTGDSGHETSTCWYNSSGAPEFCSGGGARARGARVPKFVVTTKVIHPEVKAI